MMIIYSRIRVGLLSTALLLTTAMAAPSFAESPSLPELSPRQIASDIKITQNPQTGIREYAAQSFDPFEDDHDLAGTASLRSAHNVVTIDGARVRGGAILDLGFYYTSGSSDPYDNRGYGDAVFLSGDYAAVTQRDNRILECSQEMQDVVYYHQDYYAPSFHRNLYRPYRHYSGFNSFGRFGYGGYSSFGYSGGLAGRGFFGQSSRGHRRGIRRLRHGLRNGVRRDDARGRRADDRRRRDNSDDETPRTRDGDRDRVRDRNRDRVIDGNRGRNRDDRIRDRNRDRLRDGRTRRRLTETERRATMTRGPGRGRALRNQNDRGGIPRIAEPRPTTGSSNTSATRGSVPRRIAPRLSSPGQVAPRQVAPSPATARRAPPQRRDTSRSGNQSRPDSARSNRSSSRNRNPSDRGRSNRSFRQNSGLRSARMIAISPMASLFGRSHNRSLSSQCAREEKLSLHIPQERLDAGRFDGMTLLVLDSTGHELPVFIPPNYIEGFRQALATSYNGQAHVSPPHVSPPNLSSPDVSDHEPSDEWISSVPESYTSEPYTSEPYTSEPYTSEPVPDIDSCPEGTTLQTDGSCLPLEYFGYPTE